ncbi:hypothetical protein N7516_008429 [Penicillium verrucosum]|uniref:uncharacterized protein n=1 Tax=Penicillium verrucosum TaxID=60171 RepID=UPI002545B137|nr:uncharacterized protein N7516_008429 [Penicillium verrucosum]KAJ5926656.1 hypothetical protein N7516_008429 [Penicillium verrucosum]
MDMNNVNRPAINITLVWTFFALAALDVAVNAAAGPAAVATAAHVNGSPLTARAMQIGALAGVTKSGVLAFVEFAGFAGLPTPAWILLVLVASGFGICVLVTAEVSNLVLGETPSALLIAAVVAAIPLAGECIGLYECYDICPYNVAAAAGAVYGVITGFFHVILGCMAGFTFYESTNGHYEIRNVFGTARGYNPNWNSN